MPQPQKIQILIANDQPLLREGLATVLNRQQNIEVVAQTDNVGQLLDYLRRYHPKILITDLRLGGVETFTIVKNVREEFPSVGILILSGSDGSEDIHRAIRAGARGYISKDISDSELVEAIETVSSGGRHISEQIAVQLSQRMDKSTLTRREMQVLQLVTKGKSNKEIAIHLNMAEETVKHHMDNILSKLGVGNRTSAATAALLRGIIHPQDF